MKDQKGEITVFLSMIFLVFLLLVSTCLEGMYIYVGKGKAAAAYMSALAHARGNYQKQLFEDYHILALDPRYAEIAETDLTSQLSENLENGNDDFSFSPGEVTISEPVSLADKNGNVLKYQIREFMKYDLGKAGFQKLQEKISSSNSKSQTDQIKQEMEDTKNAAKEDKEEHKKKEGKKKEDPRKGFMKLLKTGIVSLVLKDQEVSSETVPVKYGTMDQGKESSTDFFNSDSVEKSLSDNKTEQLGSQFASEVAGIAYASRYFHCFTSENKKSGIQYETEYLIGGKKDDTQNLASVFHKIILLRFFINEICLYSDSGRKAQAQALAAAIAGIIGIPPVVVLAKHLLLAALAYGESVIDMRCLAKGKRVGIIKTKDGWQLEFSGLATLSAKEKPVSSKGLSYEDYLCILLALQQNHQKKYMRMLDVIEANIQKKIPDFSVKKSYVSFGVNTTIGLNSFRFAGLSMPFPARYQFPMKYINAY